MISRPHSSQRRRRYEDRGHDLARQPQPAQPGTLADFLAKGGYATATASSLEAFDTLLAEQKRSTSPWSILPALTRRFGSGASNYAGEEMPVSGDLAQTECGIQQASLTHGAKGIMIKPLVTRELLGIIESMLRGNE